MRQFWRDQDNAPLKSVPSRLRETGNDIVHPNNVTPGNGQQSDKARLQLELENSPDSQKRLKYYST